jgi:radical SAM/CxCxxxxC motif protein YfkAB
MPLQPTGTEAVPSISPRFDPWDPLHSRRRHGRHVLTSVEITVSNLCNMRCEHCAVGHQLVLREGDKRSLAELLSRLDEVEHLQTISITGGEPTFLEDTVDNWIIPILRYARERGLKSQLNSNLTLDYARYERIAPHLDVMHISFNYTCADDFYRIGFANAGRPVPRETAYRLYERMMDNARRLSAGGLLVSAESMLNTRTRPHLADIHRLIVEMGCFRHEVHPMYQSDFAEGLPVLTLDELREAVGELLDVRDPSVWMLFGTLPFFRCSDDPRDQALLDRLAQAENVTVRNDPDGRNRLNVNLFTGDVYVTDFASVPPLGNIAADRLDDVFERWLDHPLCRSVNCHCPHANCCGPNLLVKSMYYPSTDFTARRAAGG